MLLKILGHNYITLIILLCLALLILSNKNERPHGVELVWLIMVMLLVVSLNESIRAYLYDAGIVHTATGSKREYILAFLYTKTFIEHCLYPLIILVEVMLISDMQKKFLLFIPELIVVATEIINLFWRGLVFRYNSSDLVWGGGMLHFIPYIAVVIYMLILLVYSIKLLSGKDMSKGMVVVFITLITFIGCILEFINAYSGLIDEITAIDILVYYYYYYAIYLTELKNELHERNRELESNKVNLLMAQIRPHFINSNLAVIRSLCYEDTDKAVEMIDHFSEYLRDNMQQIDDMRLVPFEHEMESVDNYIYLEQQRFVDRIEIIRDINVTDFEVPPLSIQTIVENAVRHGISMKGTKGTIKISTEKTDDEILVTIADDGTGFDVSEEKFDGKNHVGIRNVKDRLYKTLQGHVIIKSDKEKGTKVTFHIPVTQNK